MRSLNFANWIIKYSFYALFLLTPFALSPSTFELFEFNKMWVVFGLTILITFGWLVKMTVLRRVFIKRTPLDIPILLFLISQVISTIFSWDQHVSFWGYYSRFNGGLLSTISYLLLYYAFCSNFMGEKVFSIEPAKEMVKKLLSLSVISALLVTLWGLPSHFGYDPTCFLFRGNLDVSCWTEDFQPKIRIFSTLGQPNWLAAYLAIILPISLSFALLGKSQTKSKFKFVEKIKDMEVLGIRIPAIIYFVISGLFVLAILYTRSQSGFLGLGAEIFVFLLAVYLFQEKVKNLKKISSLYKILIGFLIMVVALIFFAGIPIERFNKFTLDGIRKAQVEEVSQNGPSLENNITSSWDIRKIVWRGGIETWRSNPLIGTGLETFAFSYYKYKPAEHNLTSEWNFLYNKAHSEYLNFLSTAGILGLGTYLFMLGSFLFILIRALKKETDSDSKILSIGLLAGYTSILVTNSVGFSVVITQVYLFLIPAFSFAILGIGSKKSFIFPGLQKDELEPKVNLYTTGIIILLSMVALYLILGLFRFWRADTNYALGYNLDRVGGYDQAYTPLLSAVSARPDEPVFKDELAVNNAMLVLTLLSNPNPADATASAQAASQLADNAIKLSDEVTTQYPNNIVFLKSRVRILYNLAQVNPAYLTQALETIKKAAELAPNDAIISYNLGIIYGQTGDVQKGVEVLENTIKLKPDYKDAYYALGLFYHELATNNDQGIVDEAYKKKAEESLNYILENIASDDAETKQLLESLQQ